MILTKGGPDSETQNTFNLPTGADIQTALVSIFRDQRAAILAFLQTGNLSELKSVSTTLVDPMGTTLAPRLRDAQQGITGDTISTCTVLDDLSVLHSGASSRKAAQAIRQGSSRATVGEKIEFKWGLPLAWPTWDSLGLGVSNFVERLEDSIKSIWEKAGAGFLALLGLDPDGWDANDPKNIALIEQGLKDLATEVNGTTSDQLQKALDTVAKEVADGSITTDQAEAELTKDVDAIFGNAEDWRAKMIAVTEASRAYHQAIAEAAREFGDVVGWQWKTNGDPCDICIEIEAECQFVPEGRPFAIIGDNSTYQTIDMPPAHPRCMCTAEPVMAGDEPPDWGDTLIQPTGKKGYAPEHSLGIKAFPVPKRFPRPIVRD
jgi:hypothetical protein